MRLILVFFAMSIGPRLWASSDFDDLLFENFGDGPALVKILPKLKIVVEKAIEADPSWYEENMPGHKILKAFNEAEGLDGKSASTRVPTKSLLKEPFISAQYLDLRDEDGASLFDLAISFVGFKELASLLQNRPQFTETTLDFLGSQNITRTPSSAGFPDYLKELITIAEDFFYDPRLLSYLVYMGDKSSVQKIIDVVLPNAPSDLLNEVSRLLAQKLEKTDPRQLDLPFVEALVTLSLNGGSFYIGDSPSYFLMYQVLKSAEQIPVTSREIGCKLEILVKMAAEPLNNTPEISKMAKWDLFPGMVMVMGYLRPQNGSLKTIVSQVREQDRLLEIIVEKEGIDETEVKEGIEAAFKTGNYFALESILSLLPAPNSIEFIERDQISFNKMYINTVGNSSALESLTKAFAAKPELWTANFWQQFTKGAVIGATSQAKSGRYVPGSISKYLSVGQCTPIEAEGMLALVVVNKSWDLLKELLEQGIMRFPDGDPRSVSSSIPPSIRNELISIDVPDRCFGGSVQTFEPIASKDQSEEVKGKFESYLAHFERKATDGYIGSKDLLIHNMRLALQQGSYDPKKLFESLMTLLDNHANYSYQNFLRKDDPENEFQRVLWLIFTLIGSEHKSGDFQWPSNPNRLVDLVVQLKEIRVMRLPYLMTSIHSRFFVKLNAALSVVLDRDLDGETSCLSEGNFKLLLDSYVYLQVDPGPNLAKIIDKVGFDDEADRLLAAKKEIQIWQQVKPNLTDLQRSRYSQVFSDSHSQRARSRRDQFHFLYLLAMDELSTIFQQPVANKFATLLELDGKMDNNSKFLLNEIYLWQHLQFKGDSSKPMKLPQNFDQAVFESIIVKLEDVHAGYESNFNQDGAASEAESDMVRLTQVLCVQVGCRVTAPIKLSQTGRVYDSAVYYKGETYILEFNGPSHYIYDAHPDSLKFVSTRKEERRQQALEHFFPKKILFIPYYNLRYSDQDPDVVMEKEIKKAFQAWGIF